MLRIGRQCIQRHAAGGMEYGAVTEGDPAPDGIGSRVPQSGNNGIGAAGIDLFRHIGAAVGTAKQSAKTLTVLHTPAVNLHDVMPGIAECGAEPCCGIAAAQ